MATRQPRKTTKASTSAKAKAVTEENAVNEEIAVDEAIVEKKTKETVEKRVFGKEDLIPCKSITVGRLGMIGVKTKYNYEWSGLGDIVEVEYQDLEGGLMTGKSQITNPSFIVLDDDFIERFPKLENIYRTMYTNADLRELLLNPSANQMESIIRQLPTPMQEQVKMLASSMIVNGELDSVQKIQALDNIFGTKFMVATGLY